MCVLLEPAREPRLLHTGTAGPLLPARRDFLYRGEELSQKPVWSSSSLPCCHPGFSWVKALWVWDTAEVASKRQAAVLEERCYLLARHPVLQRCRKLNYCADDLFCCSFKQWLWFKAWFFPYSVIGALPLMSNHLSAGAASSYPILVLDMSVSICTWL